MTLENELRLSFYKEIGVIDAKHCVKLVQHIESNRVFVWKALKIYDLPVFSYLKSHQLQGVPAIEELIEDNGRLYVIEEYISGENLRSKLDSSGPLSEKQALKIINQLCDILLPLHSLDPPIVHRDIKPSNIIQRPDGSIVLVDFNSAKETDEDQARDTVLIGTVGYAAPEQFGFSSSQPTTDVYAIGVLLNELLTGHLPSAGIYEGPLQSVIKTCLEMDPHNRYQTIQALKTSLQRFILPDFPSAKPPTWRFTPPGFRSKKSWKMLLAVCWYAFITWLSLSLQVENTYGAALYVARFLCLFIFYAVTFWSCNYLDAWTYMPFSSSRNNAIKIVGVIFWGVSLMVTAFFLGVLFISIFFE